MELFVLPYNLVDMFTKPGLSCMAGVVPMNQYMSKTHSNGGNDNCHSLFKSLRWMKDRGNGPTLNTLIGASNADIMLKGQGQPKDFIAVWDFMCRNREDMKKVKVDVAERRERKNAEQLVISRSGNVYDLYFKGNSDATAIGKMVEDRFFGIDCIGFVANFLIYAGVWSKYHGYTIPQWASRVVKNSVKKAADIKPTNIIIWDHHIAIVDILRTEAVNGKVQVDICQSSGGAPPYENGPQCNCFVTLSETKLVGLNARAIFKIEGGSPPLPVTGYVAIMEDEQLYYY